MPQFHYDYDHLWKILSSNNTWPSIQALGYQELALSTNLCVNNDGNLLAYHLRYKSEDKRKSHLWKVS